MNTATEPLKIQVTEDNKAHVISSNRPLHGTGRQRHRAALSLLENIINSSYKTGEREVDLYHNTNIKTIEHKKGVDKYVYFKSLVKIGDRFFDVELSAEQPKGQTTELLDLYNVRVKRSSLHYSTVGAPSVSNITPISKDVKSFELKNDDFTDTMFGGSPEKVNVGNLVQSDIYLGDK